MLVASGACLAVAGWLVLGHAAHRGRPELPGIGAYADGGAPARDPALEAVLGDRLAALAIATDEARRGSSAGERERVAIDAELRASPVIARLGPGAVLAWRDLLDALARWSDTGDDARTARDAAEALRHRAQAFTDQLALLGLGYYVEGATFGGARGRHGAVFAYRVEDVAFVRAGPERRRVLQLRRIDRLDAERALLGLEPGDEGDPIVLLDQIDDFIARKLAPVLAGEPYELGGGFASLDRLELAAGDAVRRELVSVPSVRDAVVATVRRHEARHAIDLDRGDPPRAPAALVRLVGSHPGGPFERRARAELAAYLSQIANDPATPQLALWNLASQALHAGRWGTPEAYVAVVVLEGLGRRIGPVPAAPCVQGGQLDRGELAQIALPLTQLTDEELRIQARALWHELYGDTLLTLE